MKDFCSGKKQRLGSYGKVRPLINDGFADMHIENRMLVKRCRYIPSPSRHCSEVLCCGSSSSSKALGTAVGRGRCPGREGKMKATEPRFSSLSSKGSECPSPDPVQQEVVSARRGVKVSVRCVFR